MKKTTLYLPEDLDRALKEAVHRTGRSEANLIREALAAYLQSKPRPRPRSIGAGEDPDFSARETEAWLKAHWVRT